LPNKYFLFCYIFYISLSGIHNFSKTFIPAVDAIEIHTKAPFFDVQILPTNTFDIFEKLVFVLRTYGDALAVLGGSCIAAERAQISE